MLSFHANSIAVVTKAPTHFLPSFSLSLALFVTEFLIDPNALKIEYFRRVETMTQCKEFFLFFCSQKNVIWFATKVTLFFLHLSSLQMERKTNHFRWINVNTVLPNIRCSFAQTNRFLISLLLLLTSHTWLPFCYSVHQHMSGKMLHKNSSNCFDFCNCKWTPTDWISF